MSEVERVYYAIPTAYTIGEEYNYFQDALEVLVHDVNTNSASNINRGYIDERKVIKHTEEEGGGSTDLAIRRWTLEVRKVDY